MATKYYESEQCFRRYENVIVQAVLSYPQEVRFKPEVRSIATDEARCRDAISSWRRKKWISSVDQAAYQNAVNDIVVWSSLGYICVGPSVVLKIHRQKMRGLDTKVKVDSLVVYPFANEESEPEEKDPYLTELQFNSLSLEQAVDMLDKNKHRGPYLIQNTPENLLRTQNAIGDRMNVAFVINKEGLIQIF
jgi:hypothetical protein